MKKILLFVAFIVIAFIATAQTNSKWYSYRNEMGVWNKYTSAWEFGEMNEAYIPIHYGKEYIRLENQNKSYFTITEDKGESSTYSKKHPTIKITTHEWSAYDKDGRRCVIMLSTTTNSEIFDPMVLTIMYSDLTFRFYCKIKEIDSFIEQ